MVDPITINRKVGINSHGGSVRWKPGQSERIGQRRVAGQESLRNRLSPVANPSQDIAKYIHQNRSVIGPYDATNPATALPVADNRGHEYLLNRVTSNRYGKTSIAGRPVVVDSSAIGDEFLKNRKAKGIALFPGTRDVYANARQITPDLIVSSALEGQARTRTLAHELGHYELGHTRMNGLINENPDSRLVDIAGKLPFIESEAEAVAYGVLNRLYPMHDQYRDNSAAYMRRMEQRGIDQAVQGYGDASSVPVEVKRSLSVPNHLKKPEVNADINRVVQMLVPTPRQPFKAMIPDAWSGARWDNTTSQWVR